MHTKFNLIQTMKILKILFTGANKENTKAIEYAEILFDTEDGLVAIENTLQVSFTFGKVLVYHLCIKPKHVCCC